MKIAVGADHRGTQAAQTLKERLAMSGHDVTTFCSENSRPADYPDPAWRVANAVSTGEVERGILLCGSGVGMCIAANKVKGVRAAPVHDEITAEVSRAHVDANVLCLSADLLGQRLIEKIVDIWLRTKFESGRHVRRVNKIRAIEDGRDPTLETE